MKILIERDTENVIISTETNEHPYTENPEFQDKCLMIKFMKQEKLDSIPEDYKEPEGPFYFLDESGLNGLLNYLQYLKDKAGEDREETN